MQIDLFVLNGSVDDPGKVEFRDSIDVVGDFVPRVGDFMCIPGSAKIFVVSRVLINWVAKEQVLSLTPRVRVDLDFVPRGVYDDY